jgi:hypothetical protein
MDLKALKESQAARVADFKTIRIESWGTDLKIRKLTARDEIKASAWARKNYSKRAEIANGCALVCLSVMDEALPLTTDTVEFLLGEPVEVIRFILEAVKGDD